MDQEGIHYVWAPIYSPELNPIEMVFSQLKDRVKKARLKAMVNGQRPSYDILVQNAVNEIGIEIINNCVKHVLKFFKL